MSSELLAIFEYLEREKGISRGRIIEAIEASLLTASKKAIHSRSNLSVQINQSNADIKVWAELEVVGYPTDDPDEIYLDEAIEIDPNVKEGDSIKIEVTPKNFGRIAAQTAKQVIIQKLREAEKDMIVEEFRDRVGQLVTGIVRRHAQGNIIVDIDKAEAIVPPEEQVMGERCHPGMRLTALVIDVREGEKGPEIILSRNRPDLIRKLFELEIPEIEEGTVSIKSIAREAGHRTKIAVASNDKRIDCVGACVGMRGARVKNIVRELNGEKIDIIRYDTNIEEYVKEALSPASPTKIELESENNLAIVVVKDDEYSLAIGKQGQNARLTSKLIGWKIDIVNESRYEKKGHKLAERLMEIPGIDRKTADELSKIGFVGMEEIANAPVSQLTQIEGLGELTAMKIQELIRLQLEAEASGRTLGPSTPEEPQDPVITSAETPLETSAEEQEAETAEPAEPEASDIGEERETQSESPEETDQMEENTPSPETESVDESEEDSAEAEETPSDENTKEERPE